MADSGLMGEVLSSLQTELLATLKGVEVRSVKAHLQEAGQCQMAQPFWKEAIISAGSDKNDNNNKKQQQKKMYI